MKGDVTPTLPSLLLPPPASLGSSLGPETPEHERVAAAYALGRHASAGDPSAVAMLRSGLNFVSKMMNFAFKMVNFVFKMNAAVSAQRGRR